MNSLASTVQALAGALPGARIVGSAARVITGVVYDSRIVQPGDLFAALRGADFDGHQFVHDAEERGAAARAAAIASSLTPAASATPAAQSAFATLNSPISGN